MPRRPPTPAAALPPWADPEIVRPELAAWLVSRGMGLGAADAYGRMAASLLRSAVDPAELERKLAGYSPATAAYARSVLRKAIAWADAEHPTWQLPVVPRPRRKAAAPEPSPSRVSLPRRRWASLAAYLSARLYVGSTTLHRARVGWIRGRGSLRQWAPDGGRPIDLHEGDALVIAALLRIGYGYDRAPRTTDPLFAIDGRPVSRQTVALGVKLGRGLARDDLTVAARETVEAVLPGRNLAVFSQLDRVTLVHRPELAGEPMATPVLEACEHGQPRAYCPICPLPEDGSDAGSGHEATRALLAAWSPPE